MRFRRDQRTVRRSAFWQPAMAVILTTAAVMTCTGPAMAEGKVAADLQDAPMGNLCRSLRADAATGGHRGRRCLRLPMTRSPDARLAEVLSPCRRTASRST